MHRAGDLKSKHKFLIVAKGAPEIMQKLLEPKRAETDYESQFEAHTKDGKRVLALGYRYLGEEFSAANAIV